MRTQNIYSGKMKRLAGIFLLMLIPAGMALAQSNYHFALRTDQMPVRIEKKSLVWEIQLADGIFQHSHLEAWMSDGASWFHREPTDLEEETPGLDSWMLDAASLYQNGQNTKTEEGLLIGLEDWMFDFSENEKEPVLEDWMLHAENGDWLNG